MDSAEKEKIIQCYSDWSAQYYDLWSSADGGQLAPHLVRLHEFVKEADPRTLLDAGCGSASFLRTLDAQQIDFYGFDLTPAMIEEGRSALFSNGVSGDRLWVDDVTRFRSRPTSMQGEPAKGLEAYDMIVCAGVLNHIEKASEEVAFRALVDALEPGGTLAVQARNAYFSLFTANRHSANYVINHLADMASLKSRVGSDVQALCEIEKDWRQHFSLDEPPSRETVAEGAGYDTVLNRFHDPLVLQNLCSASGLTECQLVYCNYHPLPPMYAARVPDLFRELALEMEKNRDLRGLFMASSFFVVGTKAPA